MPKVKIVWTQSFSDDYDTKIILRGVPDEAFEDISEEDLQLLRRNLYRIPRPHYDFSPAVVLLDEIPVEARLETIKETLKKIEAEAQLAKEKRAKAQLKAKKTREDRERAKFEALKEKYGGE